MDTNQLEALLEGASETPAFDVKAAMAWDERKLAKDILALANIRDGGYVLIGVEDHTFARQGVDVATMASYNEDIMRDQMAKWADPHVEFSVSYPVDTQGIQYVAIRVASFRDIPVICRKDSADTKAGAIYYRTTNQRVQSVAINNSYDMRDLIMTAAARMRESWRQLGIDVTTSTDQFRKQLDDELEGL